MTSRASTAGHHGVRGSRAHTDRTRLLALVVAAIMVALTASPALVSPASAQPVGTDQRFARILLDELTPAIVTSTSGPELTIRGTVVNTSDRALSALGIRLERGDPVADARGLRTSLAVQHPPIAAATDFEQLTDELNPGERTRIDMSIPLGESGLDIDGTGVYPLQININGVPDYGAMAQVAGSRMLLPVVSLPPDEDRAEQFIAGAGPDILEPGLGPDGSVSADVRSPSRFTMLWPVSAPTQLAPGILGDATDPVRLTSDALATSLRPDGRLHDVLAGLRGLIGTEPAQSDAEGEEGDQPSPEPTPPGAPSEADAPPNLQDSVCVAIDPDLLMTVQAVAQRGFAVSTDPADPTAETVPGDIGDTASNWLAELRDIATQMCVVALPFAQADLSSLSQIASAGLNRAAIDEPSDIVDAILGVASVRGLAIPSGGAFDGSAATALRDTTAFGAVVPSAGVAPVDAADPGGAYRVEDLAVQTTDSSLTAALAGLGRDPYAPAVTPADQRVDLDSESAVSRRQSAVASLAFSAINTGRGSGADSNSDPVEGRGQLVSPPAFWAPTAADATSLFTTMTLLSGARLATPTPFTEVVTDLADASTPATLTDVTIDPSSRINPETASSMRELANLSWQLQGALVSSADVGVSPDAYVSPLREDVLRALRVAPRVGASSTAAILNDRGMRMTAVSATLTTMRQGVTILDPGGRYTLASERSPLLLVIRNDLALPVRVRITSSGAADLNVGDIGATEIPARGTRQIQLPTQAENSEATQVTIAMDAVTGLRLGTPITMSVHANAYGGALFVITICAGVVLVGLTARRLWHRFRGEPDPADEDRPEPDETERVLAASSYQQRRRNLQNEGADEMPYPRLPSDRRLGPDAELRTPRGPRHAARRDRLQRGTDAGNGTDRDTDTDRDTGTGRDTGTDTNNGADDEGSGER